MNEIKITQAIENGERMVKIVRETPRYAMLWLARFNRPTPFAKEICQSLFDSMRIIPSSIDELENNSIGDSTIYQSRVGGSCIEIETQLGITYYWMPKLSIS